MNSEESNAKRRKQNYFTSPKRLYKSEARVIDYFRDYSELPVVRTAILKGFNSELDQIEYMLESKSWADTKELEELKTKKLALEIGIMRIREMLDFTGK